MTFTPFDPNCGRLATDITSVEVGAMIEWEDPTPWDSLTDHERAVATEKYARSDGTFNPTNGHFLCDECYIKLGQPSSPRGWKCP